MRNQKGISLIELMIAITLSMVLLGGVIQIFLSSKAVFSTQTGISRVQETGRLAIEFLSRDIRMAGFLGCMNRGIGAAIVLNGLNNPATFQNRMELGIEGHEVLPAGAVLNPAPEANTDILVLRIANSNTAVVSSVNSPAQVFVRNSGAVPGACPGNQPSLSGICAGDFLAISNCFNARVFQASAVAAAAGEVVINHSAAGDPGNLVAVWPAGEQYGPGSEVLTINHIVYYVATSPASNRPALYQNINGISLELLEGVENMQLTYSRAQNPSVYQRASDIPNIAWNLDPANPVVSVRIELLVSSVDQNVLEEPQSYTLEGNIVTPDDRRLRKVFVNTTGIRGRLP